MADYFVGIDISKLFFDASVEVDGKIRHRQFANSEKGFESFLEWLQKWGVSNAHCCMEATGSFWVQLSTWLYEHKVEVSVVNPACIKRFAQSELKRTKTDKVDAGVIARFCKAMRPILWQPLPEEVQKLQKLVRRHYDLGKMRQQERNRHSSCSMDEPTLASVERILNVLENEIARIERQIERLYKKHQNLNEKRELLLSIPGVGKQTAHVVMAEIPCPEYFESAKQLVAYAGLAPREISSGQSIRGRTTLSKTGRSRLRSALFMPSVSARTHNQLLRDFGDRLLKNGKPPMKVVAATMRKFLHIIFGVLKSGKPFRADYRAA